MLFNSPIFLFLFLPITYIVFWALQTKNSRYVWLTITGYVFYAGWNPKFCLLMLFSTVISYTAGLGLLYASDPRLRKVLLITPITLDLLLLGFFKYFNLVISTWNSLTAPWRPPFAALDIVLPIGISFYTFHTITYIVDSYREHITPTRNFWEFSAYVSLFSQLVAGPIVRFSELQQDLEYINEVSRTRYLSIGCSYFMIGLAQKLLLADTVAAIINPAFEHIGQISTFGVWLCLLGYTYQLYFDFAGYSNMAIGLGYLFGMHIPRNFRSPYKALNPSDFWTRWHISLSRCLKDYLYIPMGGNRKGRLRTYFNLLFTMLLGGLWHGASWNFVVWGAYHGSLLCFYKIFQEEWDRLPQTIQRVMTFLLVVFGWSVFRADNWADALTFLNQLLIPHSGTGFIGETTLVCALLVCAGFAHFGPAAGELRHDWRWAPALGLAALFFLCLADVVGKNPSKFLYFQF